MFSNSKVAEKGGAGLWFLELVTRCSSHQICRIAVAGEGKVEPKVTYSYNRRSCYCFCRKITSLFFRFVVIVEPDLRSVLQRLDPQSDLYQLLCHHISSKLSDLRVFQIWGYHCKNLIANQIKVCCRAPLLTWEKDRILAAVNGEDQTRGSRIEEQEAKKFLDFSKLCTVTGEDAVLRHHQSGQIKKGSCCCQLLQGLRTHREPEKGQQ